MKTIFFTIILLQLFAPIVFSLVSDEFSKIVVSTDGKDFHVYDIYNIRNNCSLNVTNPFPYRNAPKRFFFGEILSNRLFICGDYLSTNFTSCLSLKKDSSLWRKSFSTFFPSPREGSLLMKTCRNEMKDQLLLTWTLEDTFQNEDVKFFDANIASLTFISNLQMNHSKLNRIFMTTSMKDRCFVFFEDSTRYTEIDFSRVELARKWLEIADDRTEYVRLWTLDPKKTEPRIPFDFVGRAIKFYLPKAEKEVLFIDIRVGNPLISKTRTKFVLFDTEFETIMYDRHFTSNIDLQFASKLVRLKSTFGVFVPTSNNKSRFYIFNPEDLVFESSPLAVDLELPKYFENQLVLGLPDDFVQCNEIDISATRVARTTEETMSSGASISLFSYSRTIILMPMFLSFVAFLNKDKII